MTQYSQKTINNLTPNHVKSLSKKDRELFLQQIKEEKAFMLENKPKEIKGFLVCKTPTSTITKGVKYKVLNHFCTLVTTIYGSKWNEFVTIKNDYGYTVKVNVNNFETKEDMINSLKDELGL
jgi:hypothetical protein